MAPTVSNLIFVWAMLFRYVRHPATVDTLPIYKLLESELHFPPLSAFLYYPVFLSGSDHEHVPLLLQPDLHLNVDGSGLL